MDPGSVLKKYSWRKRSAVCTCANALSAKTHLRMHNLQVAHWSSQNLTGQNGPAGPLATALYSGCWTTLDTSSKLFPAEKGVTAEAPICYCIVPAVLRQIRRQSQQKAYKSRLRSIRKLMLLSRSRLNDNTTSLHRTLPFITAHTESFMVRVGCSAS